MTVRTATSTDVDRVSELAASTFPLACPPGTRPEDMDDFISNVLSPGRFQSYIEDASRVVLIDETADEQLTGYALLVTGEPADPEIRATLRWTPTIEVSKLYVRPTAHGTGVADALLTAAMAVAVEKSCAGAWLGVNQLNHRAQRFYRRQGFEVVGTKTFTVGAQSHDDFFLERRLSDGGESGECE